MSFGHFIPLGILSYLDKMSFGHFVHGHFVIRGHFVTLGISSYNLKIATFGQVIPTKLNYLEVIICLGVGKKNFVT